MTVYDITNDDVIYVWNNTSFSCSLIFFNRCFSQHLAFSNTGVVHNINDGCVPFSYSSARILLLYMLAHCDGLLGHLNRTESLLMLLVSPDKSNSLKGERSILMAVIISNLSCMFITVSGRTWTNLDYIFPWRQLPYDGDSVQAAYYDP